jgi:type I restriction-modification system DNA methylase subunit
MDEAGFDAVVGNPPYVKIQSLENDIKRYTSQEYQSACGRFDIYMPFVERGLSLARANRFLTFILPSKFTETESGSNLRTLLTENHSIIHYTNIKYQVFSSAMTYTCVLTAQKDVSRDSFRFSRVKSREAFSNIDSHQISNGDLSDNAWNLEKYDTDLFPLSQKLKPGQSYS